MKKIGFIGCGTMGSTLVRGFLYTEVVAAEEISVYDREFEKAEALKKALEVDVSSSALQIAESCELLFLAVKPQDIDDLLGEIKEAVAGKLIVSIAAGVTTKNIEERINPTTRVIRIMPNTPARVCAMAAAVSSGKNATDDDVRLVEDLLNGIGVVLPVEEELMDAVTGLSGSGPAYVFLLIKEMAAAGVAQGLSEEVSLKLVAQTFKGSADMILRRVSSPDELIEAVSSPGGTTIEGLKVLEEEKVGEAIKKAVDAATQRAKDLHK